MEVADQIVIMSHGRVEQHGAPSELYDHPANEFVMRFMGQVEHLDGCLVRPHDIELNARPNGVTVAAEVLRLRHLGFEQRVDLALKDGRRLTARLSRSEADQLALTPGETIHARARRERHPWPGSTTRSAS